MKTPSVRFVVISLAVAASGVVTATAARRDRDPASARAVTGAEESASHDTAKVQLDSALGGIVDRNPFRPQRKPSPIRYQPGGSTIAAEVPEPEPVRPTFILRGIIDAQEPRAVIEGFPGTNQPIAVRAGEQRGAFRIEEIAKNRVVITGPDTTWTLELKPPW